MTLLIWATGVVLMVFWLASQGGAVTWWHYLVVFLFSGIWLLISLFINVLIGFFKKTTYVEENGKSEQKGYIDDSLNSFEKIHCLINTNDFLTDLFEKRTDIPIDSLDDMNDILSKMFSTLTMREDKVLRLRYGLFGIMKLPPKEIADKFGVSQETIRRYEKKGMVKMRHPSRFTRINSFMQQNYE